MKYRILAVIVIMLAFVCITVNAAGYEYTISPGDNFTSVQYGDDLTEISQKLNMTTDELNTYFNKNGLLYLAVSDDAKSQIRISAFSDNFSSAVNDISQLDDAAISEFISALSEDSSTPATVLTSNGRKYICLKSTRKDSGGVYTVTQYITICSNKTFYIAGYNDGEDTADEIETAFDSLVLNQTKSQESDFTLQTIFIISGIVIFSIVAIIAIVGIIRSTIKSNNDKENHQNEN